MKWILLAVALAAVLPLSSWLRRNPHQTPKIWALVGFLAFEHGPLHMYMAMYTWAGHWPGYVQGFEISTLDFLMLAIYFSLPKGRHSLPFLFSFGFYFSAVLLSVFQASVPIAALFYGWQLARVFFFYAVVARACEDDRVVPSILKGLAAGLFLTTFQAIWERYALGIVQTSGGYGTQNFVGLVSHFIVYPYFALLLAGEKGWLPFAVTLAGAVIAALTASRATVVGAGLGYVAVFMLSALRGWTPKKAKVLIAALATCVVLTPLLVSSFQERFAKRDEASFFQPDEVRAAMAEAAQLILSNHPMGVGANHYVMDANTMGYNAQAGLNWTNSGAIVHNVYWLVAAETGYPGLLAFVVFLLRPLTVAFKCGWRNRGDRRADALLGLGVGLLIVYLHSFYEWIFITFQAQYLFAITAGMIAGLAQQLGYWRRTSVIQINPGERRRMANQTQNFRITSPR